MSQIVLTDEQMQTIRKSTGPVDICSPDGHTLARVPPPWTAEEIAGLKGRSANGPCYSGEEVQKYMRLLEEEATRTGRCDETRARELKKQLKPMG